MKSLVVCLEHFNNSKSKEDKEELLIVAKVYLENNLINLSAYNTLIKYCNNQEQ